MGVPITRGEARSCDRAKGVKDGVKNTVKNDVK